MTAGAAHASCIGCMLCPADEKLSRHRSPSCHAPPTGGVGASGDSDSVPGTRYQHGDGRAVANHSVSRRSQCRKRLLYESGQCIDANADFATGRAVYQHAQRGHRQQERTRARHGPGPLRSLSAGRTAGAASALAVCGAGLCIAPRHRANSNGSVAAGTAL